MKNKNIKYFLLGLFFLFLLNGCSKNKNQEDLEDRVLKIISDHPEAIIESIRNHKKIEEKAKIESIKKDFFRLQNDQKIVGASPTLGSTKHDIILLKFSDFQCPYWRKSYEIIKRFMNKYDREVTFVYKHYPLTRIHPQAVLAARASWAANQQGKFWQYHDALFNNQKRLGEELYLEIAQQLKLDLVKFNLDRHSKKANTAIQKDIELGKKFGVNGTPFILLNGILISNGTSSIDTFEEALKQVKK